MENLKGEGDFSFCTEILFSILINFDCVNTYFGSFINCSCLFYIQYGNISSWGFVGLYLNSSLNTHKYAGISGSLCTQIYILKRSSFFCLFFLTKYQYCTGIDNLVEISNQLHSCFMPVELWQVLYRSNMKSTAHGKDILNL